MKLLFNYSLLYLHTTLLNLFNLLSYSNRMLILAKYLIQIESKALKLQGDFNRTIKICNHSFGNEKVSCAYKKKGYSYYNYLAIKMRFGK